MATPHLGTIDHAWVEIETPGKEVVYVHWQNNNQVYLRPIFDGQVATKRYTPDEAFLLTLATEETRWTITVKQAKRVVKLKYGVDV